MVGGGIFVNAGVCEEGILGLDPQRNQEPMEGLESWGDVDILSHLPQVPGCTVPNVSEPLLLVSGQES